LRGACEVLAMVRGIFVANFVREVGSEVCWYTSLGKCALFIYENGQEAKHTEMLCLHGLRRQTLWNRREAEHQRRPSVGRTSTRSKE
jgi:hypothetical protein